MLKMNRDQVSATRQTRLSIGFPENRTVWRKSPAVFSSHELSIMGHPVMEDWEKGYMKQLASIATSRGGRILEVGFGMGISANFIQAAEITDHTIIEANRDVFNRLSLFAKGAQKPVFPIFGFWEDACLTLPDGSFSGILFDTYPLSEADIHCNHFAFFTEAYRLLEEDGVLTYYSDEAENFSPLHRQKLRQAGFKNISRKVCKVNPPKTCKYWKAGTLMVPIVRKEALFDEKAKNAYLR